MSLLSINTNSSYIPAILARQQVGRDQSLVQSDQTQLNQDQTQLSRDSARSATEAQQAQTIQQNQGVQAQQTDLGHLTQNAQATQPTSQPVQSPHATVNTSGQTVGSVINVVA